MKQIGKEKTMTAKEISQGLGVSLELVTKKTKELFPDIVKNGVTTILNEGQIAILKNEIEKNPHLVQTYEVDLDAQMTLKLLESASYFKSKYEESKKEIETMKPKAIGYDQFLGTEGYQSMSEVARIIGIGRNSLLSILREKGYFMENNTPYQKYMNRGFKVIENVKNGFKTVSTVVDSKGIEFINKIVLDVNRSLLSI